MRAKTSNVLAGYLYSGTCSNASTCDVFLAFKFRSDGRRNDAYNEPSIKASIS